MKTYKNNILKDPASAFIVLATCLFMSVIVWQGLGFYKALLCDLLY